MEHLAKIQEMTKHGSQHSLNKKLAGITGNLPAPTAVSGIETILKRQETVAQLLNIPGVSPTKILEFLKFVPEDKRKLFVSTILEHKELLPFFISILGNEQTRNAFSSLLSSSGAMSSLPLLLAQVSGNSSSGSDTE